MNYFNSPSSAERYNKGRPAFHAGTIKHIKEFLNIENKLDKVLDIACGTGLSTMALLPIATNVFGTDISEEMLKMASKTGGIIYHVSFAEAQPFPDEEFDLLTVSSGLHWFDIDRFMDEANRVLKKNSFLVIYENSFPGLMENKDDFTLWHKEVYLQHFPSPPRNKNYDWSPEKLAAKNFILQSTENFQNAVNFNQNDLVNYLVTQSNIIAAIETGHYTYADIENWLNNELFEFFENDAKKRIFYYNNWIKYLQKT